MIFEPLGRYSAPPGYRGAGDTSEKILTLAVVRQGPDVIGKASATGCFRITARQLRCGAADMSRFRAGIP